MSLLAGDKSNAGCLVAIREWQTGMTTGSLCRSYARHDFVGHAGSVECGEFFGKASEDGRVATFETDNGSAIFGVPYHRLIDFGLRQ